MYNAMHMVSRVHRYFFWHSRVQNGSMALIFDAENNRTDCVRLLLDAGADKDFKSDVRGRVASVF
jgi:hypothetical protein